MKGIQLDPETYDLKIKNSGFVLGEISEQNQYIILKSHAGEIKEFPTLGVGIDDYTNDEDIASIKWNIRENLKQDGFNILDINIDSQHINISAKYN